MPKAIALEPATHVALNVAWVVGAVVIAYAFGVALSWLLQRMKRRNSTINDIDLLTRGPVRATFMVIAATIAVQHTTDSTLTWRGQLDHALLIAQMATTTWVVASLVFVAERRAVARFAGDADIADADRHRRKVRTHSHAHCRGAASNTPSRVRTPMSQA
jgi:cytochrome bd-type quinol oxidase subunit 2